jgi:hypothetical protein
MLDEENLYTTLLFSFFLPSFLVPSPVPFLSSKFYPSTLLSQSAGSFHGRFTTPDVFYNSVYRCVPLPYAALFVSASTSVNRKDVLLSAPVPSSFLLYLYNNNS